MSSLKAFVSSTFTDLQAHRRRVIGTLRGSSLHVDPMENWTATSSEPKEFSQERMKGCDVCILLVAFRKGYVPDGETLSITQMEYRCAVELGIPVLVFLLDDGETNWPFDERETDPEIGRWRVQLRKKHGVGLFRADPASLDVGPAVLRWLQERKPKPVLTPPFDFASFLESKRQGFVGRDWLFAEIEDWRTKRAEKSLLILGDPGIGKSAIAAELVHRQPDRVLAYHCCRADERSTLEPAKIVRALAAQVAQNLPEYAARLSDDAIGESNCNTDPINAFGRGLLAPLRELPPPQVGVCYLLFDALDEALTRKGVGLNLVEMLAYRLDELPAWLRIVATARREDDVLEKLHALQSLQLNAQDEHNQQDVRHYVEAQTASAEVRALLVEKSEGNFLYVRQALEAIEGEADPVAVLQGLPKGLRGIYPIFFARRFPDEADYEQTKRVLQVMVAAREPLSESQLAGATGLDDEEELPGVLRRLIPFLVRRESNAGEVLALYHKSLLDWLTDKQLRGSRFYISPRTGHEQLAAWGWNEFQQDPRKMSGYALRHLPGYLLAAERWDDLATVLTDLFFLEAKAEAGLVFNLAADFGTALKALPREHAWYRRLRLLEEALGLDLAFLGRHPSALFQTLWNRCWWYDCPKAARHYRAEPKKGPPPWEAEGPKLSELLEWWRKRKSETHPGFCWAGMLRPPSHHLGTALRKILVGHKEEVTSVAVSPDGRYFASGSGDNTVRLWDAESGAELRRLEGHTDEVMSVSFRPDGKCLASGSSDGTVCLWDAESGEELRRLEGHTSDVISVAFSLDGKRLASGSRDDTVRLWDAETGVEMQRHEGHTNWVTSVSFSVDGKRLASGSYDGSLRLWDTESGAELLRIEGHTGVVTSVSFSVDGKRLASGSADKTLRLWDAESGAELRRLEGHTGMVTSVSFSVDGERLASGSDDKTVRLWDVVAAAELLRFEGHTGLVTSVSFSVDGKRVASGSEDRTVRLWDAESAAELRHLEGHTSWVTGVSFSVDGKRLASGSYDRTVRLWDAKTGLELRRLEGHMDWVNSVSFSADGRRLASGSLDNTVRLWDAQTGVELRRLEGHTSGVTCVSFSVDGKRLAAGSYDGTVSLWDAESGVDLRWLDGPDEMISVSFSVDGKRLATGSDDGTVGVWDAESGECLELIQGDTDPFAAARAADFPWRAVRKSLETVIRDSNTGKPIAWIALTPDDITIHPSGRIWAGRIADYVCLFALEGGDAGSPAFSSKKPAQR